jgi:hypothetical protein
MQSGLIEARESAKCKVTFAPPDPIVPTRLLSSQLCRWARRGLRSAVLLAFLPTLLFGKVTGSISGTVKDSTGAVIPGANVEARNVHTGVIETSVTDAAGFYNFATLPVGTYDVSVNKDGFTGYQEKSLVIDVDSALRVDAVLNVGGGKQEITVTAAAAQVDTQTNQIGEVIGSTEMANLPLNGRAYTDLLALQPGVVPFNVSQYGTLSPSNSLNNGVLVMSGQRDVQNGFMVNGANTVEGDEGGTTVIPNLDSIAEFRIILNNAGAEYGNYSGGQINVVTKSGTNRFHGDAFEFVRNSDFDSRNFYSGTRGVLHQNQFGGTLGGPILRNKAFFFVDYQGTRQVIGVDTGLILVPSVADKSGNVADQAGTIAAAQSRNPNVNTVDSVNFANILSGRLGYPVTSGERYFSPSCTTTAQCVFPNYMIPQAAWDTPSKNTVMLIPDPNTQGSYFSTASQPATLQDDKAGARIDGNTKIGMISGYWHYDPWTNNTPYAPFAGSSFPGFPISTVGKAQLFTFGVTTNFGGSSVNQFTASYMRNTNVNGLAQTKGPTLQSLGFAPPNQGGIYQLEGAAYQNWPYIGFNNYGLGQYVVVRVQDAETYQLQDDFTKVEGAHTIKFGADYHWDHVPLAQVNNEGNGGFSFNGSETGFDLADMLIGAPSYFSQGAPAALNLRNFYVGVYGEDSWRVRPDLTLNYGVRWETTPYWADRHNRNPDVQLGCQSKIFPTAPLGYCFPGDPGIPRYFVNPRWDNFGPRLGIAYSPNFSNGFLHKVFGDAGKSSIRAGYGTFFTNIEGANTFNFAAAPYSLYYPSAFPPLYSAPFINRQTGANFGQPFPVPSVTAGDTNINWSQFLPFSGDRQPYPNDPSPYAEHLNFSVQRQVTPNTLLSLAYVGTFGHHLIINEDKNPSNPALCLSLSQDAGSAQAIALGIPGVVPGTPRCGPNSETGLFYPAAGGTVSVRQPFGANYGGLGAQIMAANSAYHALEVTLRRTTGRAAYLLSYTFSKSMDNASAFGDQIILGDRPNLFRSLSLFDITHIFSLSYTYELPFDKLFRANNRATRGWKVSGVTSLATGVPVTIGEVDDNSLRGNNRNSPQYGSTDEPNFNGGGSIYVNKNPRKQYLGSNGVLVNPYFNPALFSAEPFAGQGTSNKRFFHGPGVNNWNLALLKDIRLTESKSLEFRAEFFNVFNHAQFYGSGTVNGYFDAGPSSFGGVFGAAAPRIGQIGGKFYF